MQKYENSVAQTNGEAAPNVSVLVSVYGGGVATIYGTNNTGSTPIANPITTDDLGDFAFYALSGRYTLGFSGVGITSRSETDILLFDPADYFVRPEQFGAIGGTTDDTAAFLLMRDQCRTDDTKMWHIYLDKPLYTVKDRKWLKGIRRYHLHGNGTEIKNSTSTASALAYLFANTNIFLGEDGTTFTKGSLIATVNDGSPTITLNTIAESTDFPAGTRILIYGANTFDEGYPPDPRYYEWNEVSSIVPATGVITLKFQTKYQYRSDWPDDTASTTNPTGAARVISLDRTSVTNTSFELCEQAVWENMRVPAIIPGGDATNAAGTAGCKVFKAINCFFGQIFASECEHVIFENCDIGYLALDKIVDRVTWNGGECQYSTYDGTGVRYFTANDVDFLPGATDAIFAPAHSSYKRCRMWSISVVSALNYIARSQSNYFVGSTVMEDCELYLKTGTTYQVGFIYEMFRGLGSDGPNGLGAITAVSGNEIDFAATLPQGVAVGKMARGVPFVTDTGKWGWFDYMKQGATGFGSYTHGVVPSSALIVGDKVYLPLFQSVKFKNNMVFGTARKTVLPDIEINHDAQFDLVHVQDFSVATRDVFPLGYITNIEIEVTRAYTGATATPRLYFQRAAGSSLTTIGYLDLTVVGKRSMDAVGTVFAQAGDSWAGNLPYGIFTRAVFFSASVAAQQILAGTAAQMPVVQIKMRRIPIHVSGIN